jgi:S1-C subfamily serine protease
MNAYHSPPQSAKRSGRQLFIRRLIGLSLLALLISGIQTSAADKIDANALKKVKAATVHIRVQFPEGDVSQGSGFVTKAKGLIVTNAHVVGMLDNDSRKPSKIEVTFNSGEPNSKTVEVKVGYVDGDSDLALLMMSSKDTNLNPELLQVGQSAKLTETQDVFVVGFPLGKQAGPNVTVTATTVTSLRKEGNDIKHVQVNGGMHPGNSGGPVVDKDGNVVGIAVAAFAGTQLHLAIPTEAFNSIVNGRILNIAYSVPYRDGDKLKLPFRFEKADPLGIMKSISVETWVGKAGPTRPATSTKPEPLPDDSPVTVLELKPDDKGVYSGELVLDGNKDPKLSYWIRYVVGRAGGNRWYPANLLRPATAVDRKAITIKYEPPLNKSDALALTSDAAFRIRIAGANDATLGMTLKGTLQEKVTDKTSDGKWHKRLTYDSLEALPTEDKKPLEGAEKLVKLLKDATLLASEIDVGKNGEIMRHLIDNSKVPKASRETLNDLVVDQAQQSIDSLSVPLPGKEVSPMDTWKGNQTYMLGALGYMVPVKAELTYKFEGFFMRDDKPVAVITFEGPIQSDFSSKPKKGTKPPTVTGKVDGKIEVSTDTGLIQYGTEKIRAELATETRDDKPVKASGTLNVTLRRNPPAAPKKK